MGSDAAFLDATAQAELVRSGEASPLELVEAAIGRIEKVNGELNAVIIPLYDRARAAAAGDLPDGPLQCVPFLLKHLVVVTAGEPHHAGIDAARRAGLVADHDSLLAERFRAAGLVCLGKTNTSELGLVPTAEPRASGRRATLSTSSARPVGRAAGRRRRWQRGWWRSRTRATAVARSASRPATAGWSA